jgi:hypothetical protein
MEDFANGIKLLLLMVSVFILLAVLVFTMIEGIISQLDRHLLDAIVFYLIGVASVVGILWAYTRSKYLLRAMPFEK